MAKQTSEPFDVGCPCCGAVLKVDSVTKQVIAHTAKAAPKMFQDFEEATKAGRMFSAVNEKRKVQVTDSSSFAEPIAELNRTLASPEFLDLLSDVFQMPNLLPDAELNGAWRGQVSSVTR